MKPTVQEIIGGGRLPDATGRISQGITDFADGRSDIELKCCETEVVTPWKMNDSHPPAVVGCVSQTQMDANNQLSNHTQSKSSPNIKILKSPQEPLNNLHKNQEMMELEQVEEIKEIIQNADTLSSEYGRRLSSPSLGPLTNNNSVPDPKKPSTLGDLTGNLSNSKINGSSNDLLEKFLTVKLKTNVFFEQFMEQINERSKTLNSMMTPDFYNNNIKPQEPNRLPQESNTRTNNGPSLVQNSSGKVSTPLASKPVVQVNSTLNTMNSLGQPIPAMKGNSGVGIMPMKPLAEAMMEKKQEPYSWTSVLNQLNQLKNMQPKRPTPGETKTPNFNIFEGQSLAQNIMNLTSHPISVENILKNNTSNLLLCQDQKNQREFPNRINKFPQYHDNPSRSTEFSAVNHIVKEKRLHMKQKRNYENKSQGAAFEGNEIKRKHTGSFGGLDALLAAAIGTTEKVALNKEQNNLKKEEILPPPIKEAPSKKSTNENISPYIGPQKPLTKSPKTKAKPRVCGNKLCQVTGLGTDTSIGWSRRKIKGEKYLWLCKHCSNAYSHNQFCDYCLQIYVDNKNSGAVVDGLQWIQCEFCDKWLHLNCEAKYGQKEIYKLVENSNFRYACPACKENQAKLNKKFKKHSFNNRKHDRPKQPSSTTLEECSLSSQPTPGRATKRNHSKLINKPQTTPGQKKISELKTKPISPLKLQKSEEEDEKKQENNDGFRRSMRIRDNYKEDNRSSHFLDCYEYTPVLGYKPRGTTRRSRIFDEEERYNRHSSEEHSAANGVKADLSEVVHDLEILKDLTENKNPQIEKMEDDQLNQNEEDKNNDVEAIQEEIKIHTRSSSKSPSKKKTEKKESEMKMCNEDNDESEDKIEKRMTTRSMSKTK